METLGPRVQLILLGAAALLLWFSTPQAHAARSPANVCVDCHAKLEGALQLPVEASVSSVHGHKGMSCETCHGGNPTDVAHAKSRGSGFRGRIQRKDIPELCGACHADANRMKQFNPTLRTDQLAQYRTSVHGIKFAHGDAKVAVCTDCHGAHNILPGADPRSPVHPLNVAATCARCHSDAALMKSYHLAATQVEDYNDSVHHQAMVVRGDLSAPTCSTCHGSHGAVPPGADSIANVCSTCHVLQAQFLNESPHKSAFAESCTTCHSAHKIRHPDDHFVGLGVGSACADCHTTEDEGGKNATAIHDHLARFEQSVKDAVSLLATAERAGMDVGEAGFEINQAKQALTKARVRVHTARAAQVDAELETGFKAENKARSAGESALKERDRRRKALLVPVGAIAVVVLSLGIYIRELERSGAL
jgi:hypothetical protein